MYSSQDFDKANQFAIPWFNKNYFTKFVLLVAIPGDLSDHGVAVNFSIRGGNAVSVW